ncbi:MAG: undecaprenyldiphospho-muramoylpentapeptide beta-N-acetylglucosaminyltransferase [Pseudomonadota bacterium]
MKLALAAGGTGGHMFPAQALAEEAKARGWSVLLLTDARGNRYTEGFPANRKVLLSAASPSAKGIMAKLRAGFTLLGGIMKARSELKKFGADVVVGFGGYPSAPSMVAAQRLKLPTGIHEQNAVLGRANRLAAGRAGFIAHGFPILEKHPGAAAQLEQTGNPVRRAVLDAADAPFDPPEEEGTLRLLIFGGSQGASLFAKVFAPAIASLPQTLRERLNVTHQVNDDLSEETAKIYERAGVEAEIAPFFKDLPERIAQTHLVVARSGASSVAELAVIGRPSLLVPLKIAMDDHQTVNAQVLTEAGAAQLIHEDDLSRRSAASALSKLLSDPEGLTRMAEAAKGRMEAGAAQTLADLVAALAPKASTAA